MRIAMELSRREMDNDDVTLQATLKNSLKDMSQKNEAVDEEMEKELQKAIQLSIECWQKGGEAAGPSKQFCGQAEPPVPKSDAVEPSKLPCADIGPYKLSSHQSKLASSASGESRSAKWASSGAGPSKSSASGFAKPSFISGFSAPTEFPLPSSVGTEVSVAAAGNSQEAFSAEFCCLFSVHTVAVPSKSACQVGCVHVVHESMDLDFSEDDDFFVHDWSGTVRSPQLEVFLLPLYCYEQHKQLHYQMPSTDVRDGDGN
ncbi:unnamed protein product [Gongylonema pulchrum]|uniref:Uncharacterized protein n=1 Tax=Gongylonema pulchrum TaxID=637853 RepID=A0A3P7NKC1_9BILA|nr:unnamed protein product [Gongylonema pulchrum]